MQAVKKTKANIPSAQKNTLRMNKTPTLNNKSESEHSTKQNIDKFTSMCMWQKIDNPKWQKKITLKKNGKPKWQKNDKWPKRQVAMTKNEKHVLLWRKTRQ